VLAQIRAERALDQRFLELLEQHVLARQIFWRLNS
jgi:hypothetical protein